MDKFIKNTIIEFEELFMEDGELLVPMNGLDDASDIKNFIVRKLKEQQKEK